MRKNIVLLLCMVGLFSVPVAGHATTMYFVSSDTDLYMPFGGGLIPAASNWVFAVYISGDLTAGSFGDVDDSLLSIHNGLAWAADGAMSFSLQHPGGSNMFVRIYNSSDFLNDSSFGAATMYVNVSGSMPVTLGNNTVLDYYVPTGTDPLGLDWQVIPEPGTMGLLLVGVSVLYLKRKNGRKQVS